MKTLVKKYLLYSMLVIPLNNSKDWASQKYKSIAGNEMVFSKDGIHIQVKSSASPLMHAFKSSSKVMGFKIEGDFKSLPSFKDVSLQGEKGNDDFALRIGFVIAGDKKLSGLKKLFAPDWVKYLYANVPENTGLDHVEFYNVVQNKKLLGQSRTHPSSELIHENFFTSVSQLGHFEYQYKFDKAIECLGIWLSLDGDDTKSNFEVVISKIELQGPD